MSAPVANILVQFWPTYCPLFLAPNKHLGGHKFKGIKGINLFVFRVLMRINESNPNII
jgi:hypothetical protein